MHTEWHTAVPLPPTFTPCDVHIRRDASGPAWVGVYDRTTATWVDTASGTLDPRIAIAALQACEVARG